jgi:hypothetical protein
MYNGYNLGVRQINSYVENKEPGFLWLGKKFIHMEREIGNEGNAYQVRIEGTGVNPCLKYKHK